MARASSSLGRMDWWTQRVSREDEMRRCAAAAHQLVVAAREKRPTRDEADERLRPETIAMLHLLECTPEMLRSHGYITWCLMRELGVYFGYDARHGQTLTMRFDDPSRRWICFVRLDGAMACMRSAAGSFQNPAHATGWEEYYGMHGVEWRPSRARFDYDFGRAARPRVCCLTLHDQASLESENIVMTYQAAQELYVQAWTATALQFNLKHHRDGYWYIVVTYHGANMRVFRCVERHVDDPCLVSWAPHGVPGPDFFTVTDESIFPVIIHVRLPRTSGRWLVPWVGELFGDTDLYFEYHRAEQVFMQLFLDDATWRATGRELEIASLWPTPEVTDHFAAVWVLNAFKRRGNGRKRGVNGVAAAQLDAPHPCDAKLWFHARGFEVIRGVGVGDPVAMFAVRVPHWHFVRIRENYKTRV